MVIIVLLLAVLLTGCTGDMETNGSPGTPSADQGGPSEPVRPVDDLADEVVANDLGSSIDVSTDAASCRPRRCSEMTMSCGRQPDSCGGMLDCGACPAETEMRDSIERFGITWRLSEARPVGTFVNGDPWVLGPVTITAIDPAPTGTRHGSMLDPVDAQAYDERSGRFEASKAIRLPLTIEGDHALVSSVSHPEASECMQGGRPGWQTYEGACQRGPIRTQAVLTIVSAAMPADAFRPPYAGSAKPIYRLSDICWERLPTLDAPEDLGDGAALLRHLERPWIDHLNSWQMQHSCATLNMYCYGREIGSAISAMATAVLVETPFQRELAQRLIQLGIDNAGVLAAGGGWGVDGGHFNGRKFPIVFAGLMLGDAAMASPGTDIGNEDQQTYRGEGGKALFGRVCDSCFTASCSYGGGCSSGAKDCRDPGRQVDGCGTYRNCCTSTTWVGQALAIRLMGGIEAWGHAPFFDYVDRWMSADVEGGGSSSWEVTDAMWAQYRDGAPSTLDAVCATR